VGVGVSLDYRQRDPKMNSNAIVSRVLTSMWRCYWPEDGYTRYSELRNHRWRGIRPGAGETGRAPTMRSSALSSLDPKTMGLEERETSVHSLKGLLTFFA
jgi:hypothetical protein